MKDTLIVLGFVGVLIGACVGGGFYFGRRYERIQFLKFLPGQMEATCNDCYNKGGKLGYSQGKAAGLKECDDALQELDGKGRY